MVSFLDVGLADEPIAELGILQMSLSPAIQVRNKGWMMVGIHARLARFGPVDGHGCGWWKSEEKADAADRLAESLAMSDSVLQRFLTVPAYTLWGSGSVDRGWRMTWIGQGENCQLGSAATRKTAGLESATDLTGLVQRLGHDK